MHVGEFIYKYTQYTLTYIMYIKTLILDVINRD